MLDVEPDVRSAIAQQLVIPLRSLVELVGAFEVIEEKGSGPFRGRRNQVIEIDVFKPVATRAFLSALPARCSARQPNAGFLASCSGAAH